MGSALPAWHKPAGIFSGVMGRDAARARCNGGGAISGEISESIGSV